MSANTTESQPNYPDLKTQGQLIRYVDKKLLTDDQAIILSWASKLLGPDYQLTQNQAQKWERWTQAINKIATSGSGIETKEFLAQSWGVSVRQVENIIREAIPIWGSMQPINKAASRHINQIRREAAWAFADLMAREKNCPKWAAVAEKHLSAMEKESPFDKRAELKALFKDLKDGITPTEYTDDPQAYHDQK